MATKWILSGFRSSKLFTVDCKQITLGCTDLRKRVFDTLSFLDTIVIVERYPLLLQILILYILLHKIVQEKLGSFI